MNPIIDKFGTKIYYNEKGQPHRTDGPAVIYANGTQIWYQNGLCHREDGPAAIWSDGTQYWYQHGIKVDSLFESTINFLVEGF